MISNNIFWRLIDDESAFVQAYTCVTVDQDPQSHMTLCGLNELTKYDCIDDIV